MPEVVGDISLTVTSSTDELLYLDDKRDKAVGVGPPDWKRGEAFVAPPDWKRSEASPPDWKRGEGFVGPPDWKRDAKPPPRIGVGPPDWR
jgi:hypothetical protein